MVEFLHKDPDEKKAVKDRSTQHAIDWDPELDNCGVNPEENPCGDANEY